MKCINKSYRAALITSENPELREVDLEPHCSCGSKATSRRESRFFCDACPQKPALCIEPCFQLYHEAIKNRISEE